MSKKQQSKFFNTGDSIMALAAILWGAGFPSMKYLLSFFPPLSLIAIRFIIAAILLILLFSRSIFKLTKSDCKKGVYIGIALFISFALMISGLKYTDPATLGFIVATSIVWVPLLDAAVHRKPINKYIVLSILICLSGLYLITGASIKMFNIGDLLGLLGALGISAQIIMIDRFSPMDNPSIVTIQFLVIGILSLIAALFFHQPFIPKRLPTLALLNLAFVSVVITALCFWAQTKFQGLTTATRAAFLFLLEPIFSMIFAKIFLHDTLHNTAIFGAIVILAGLIVLIISQYKLTSGN